MSEIEQLTNEIKKLEVSEKSSNDLPIEEKNNIIKIIELSYTEYINHGSRSNKKVNSFHNNIKKMLEVIFDNKSDIEVKLEQNIPSANCSGKKKCDIVIYKNSIPWIIIPIKMIMSNFRQNKNNSWENLTGEIYHIKWVNPDILIIPLNIYMNKTPYLNSNKIITKYENITLKDIEYKKILKEKNLIYDIMDYLVIIDQCSDVGDKFDKLPQITDIQNFNSLNKIFSSLI